MYNLQTLPNTRYVHMLTFDFSFQFLREDLKLDSGYEKRQKAFHYNDDMHISVKELWEAWLRSEVHNWTVEQTTEWLSANVELPQYVDNFIKHRVTGAYLPRFVDGIDAPCSFYSKYLHMYVCICNCRYVIKIIKFKFEEDSLNKNMYFICPLL